uniref:Uncharacterized protein n=1 Tax=Podoviridae sp. ct8Lf7 TaxID=2827723 RepID=A0A8S5S1B8_9CAUD|nr:MAG TPA: hypothetical protein [Podoviridae sp. ct8Lf7]
MFSIVRNDLWYLKMCGYSISITQFSTSASF